ncbi:MAG: response regulator [Desulfobacterales bacterium]|nr:response regulator [Desulfobacterales bacterium]
MNDFLKTLSIRQKLIALMMVLTGIVLILSSTLLLINEAVLTSREVLSNLSTQAKIIGYNAVAPLTFNDADAASETLSSLSTDSNLELAQVYKVDGTLFAQYISDNAEKSFPTKLAQTRSKKSLRDTLPLFKTHVAIHESIMFDGQIIGTIYLKAGMGKVRHQMLLYLTNTIIIALISILLAYSISAKLQRVVSSPILELTEMMNHVSSKKDYSVRAMRHTDDELGLLMEGFNEMLIQIQARDSELLGHQEALEETVQSRTAELQKSVKDLEEAKSDTDMANARLRESIQTAERLAREAESANQAKSRFLANMSHEIRTPMNGVIGMAKLLMDSGLNEEQVHRVDTIQKSADALLSIINDILDFSKIESGKMEFEFLDFNLLNMIENINEIMAIKAQTKGVEYIFHLDSDAPIRMTGDPSRIRQVLVNLIGNAIKFTRHGEILITITPMQNESKTFLHFSVSDTGIGIKPDMEASLFSAFSQADISTTRRFGGTGLGLAISKQLVELMGGQIGVKRRDSGGSTFWFTLPLGKESEKTGSWKPSAKIHGTKILLVDDNHTSRRILATQLKAWQCIVHEAASGLEALESLQATDAPHFSIAIIDSDMPGMDGKNLAQSIRNTPEINVPFLIYMTPLWLRGGASQFKTLGFDAYFSKPFKRVHLYNTIATLSGIEPIPKKTRNIPTSRLSVEAIKQKNFQILLVEDFPINQEVALGILESFGFRADIAETGREAVHAMERIRYDFVFMDLQMPEMDGFEATRIIRNPASQVKHHDVPIVAMTANAMKGDREKCLEAGMNDHIAKPVMPEEIYRVLQTYLLKSNSPPLETKKTVPHSPKPPPATVPVFDREELMSRVQGNEALFKRLTALFIEKTPQEMTTLKTTMEKSAMEEVRAQAHKLKGYFANISAIQLAQLAEEMQHQAEAGEEEACRALIEQIEKGVEVFEQQLKPEE